jgi:hypothetical protein
VASSRLFVRAGTTSTRWLSSSIGSIAYLTPGAAASKAPRPGATRTAVDGLCR